MSSIFPSSSSSASSTPSPRPTLRERRLAAKRRFRNRLIGGALAVGSLFVAEKQGDISGRVGRALDDRPAILKNFISAEFHTSFAQEKMAENIRYYQQLGVTDLDKVTKLAESLTRLDILVKLFSEQPSQISSHDLLSYVLGSDARIVTSQGVSLHQGVSSNGNTTGTRKNTLSVPDDLSTHFLMSFINDPNNPRKTDKNPHNLTITPRTQGGGYNFTYNYAGITESFTVDFRFPY